jgi:hypothetical protein
MDAPQKMASYDCAVRISYARINVGTVRVSSVLVGNKPMEIPVEVLYSFPPERHRLIWVVRNIL